MSKFTASYTDGRNFKLSDPQIGWHEYHETEGYPICLILNYKHDNSTNF
jgi:hypothetical protein